MNSRLPSPSDADTIAQWIDEGANCPGAVDGDGDGWFTPADCDDTDPAVNPDATEILGDGIDNDCNPATPDVLDSDLDGWDVCLPGEDPASGTCDCDDTDDTVNPDMSEIEGDGIDNDCNSATPDVTGAVDYILNIQPIFNSNCLACHGPGGTGIDFTLGCDNLVASNSLSGTPYVVPGDRLGSVLYQKVDTGGSMNSFLGNPSQAETIGLWIDQGAMCPALGEDLDGDGFAPPLDCDDDNDQVFPGAPEIIGNGIDDNCNGEIDEEPPVLIHPQPVTDCSVCHLNHSTNEYDLPGLHNNNCGLCHENPAGGGPTFLGPSGTWNNECSACHNPDIAETGNHNTPTKGHRCVVCHGEQRSTSSITSFHKNHTDRANCVACHGFVPDTGVEIGSGNRDNCKVCHSSTYSTGITTIHKNMVPKGVSCLECHVDGRPLVDVVPGIPVGNAEHVCEICHSRKDPSDFRRDMKDLHKRHVGRENMDCGFCHIDAILQDDRQPMPENVDDSRRAMVSRGGFNACDFCHRSGKRADVDEVHQRHVARQWQWCYNCHEGNDQRPIGLVPPVTQPSEACRLCHSRKSYDDTTPFRIHERHNGDRTEVKCYACHQTIPPITDWPESWLNQDNGDSDSGGGGWGGGGWSRR
jgi:hypothetical protein